MEPGSGLLGLSILVLVAAFVLRPILQPARSQQPGGNRRLSRLQAERDRILDSLREMDLDHAMGKLLPEDYRIQREALASRGASVLRQIDEAGGPPPQPAPASALESEIEAAVRQLRGSGQVADRFCGQCGKGLQPGDRFCANCGAPVPNGA